MCETVYELWTGGGDSSITLMEESLNWSRRHRTKAFRAAFEAEYAGRVGAGTIARLEPVLIALVVTTLLVTETYNIKLVSVFFVMRIGRNFMVKSTMDVKLTPISAWKAARSTVSGRARLIGL